MTYKLEICAANQASVEAAITAKAHRIELCAALEIGGITPSPASIQYAAPRIETHVLIRPRAGHFIYGTQEVAQMIEDIYFCKKAKATGVVIGLLDNKSKPNIAQLKRLIKAAEGMTCTFHRAFDFCQQPIEAMEALIDIGIQRILTSGQAASADTGSVLLRKLQSAAAGRITIMPGGGISAQNIQAIQAATQCTEFHASAKQQIEHSKSTFAGLDGTYWASSAAQIQAMLQALKAIE